MVPHHDASTDMKVGRGLGSEESTPCRNIDAPRCVGILWVTEFSLQPSWSLTEFSLQPSWSLTEFSLQPSWSLTEFSLQPSWSLTEFSLVPDCFSRTVPWTGESPLSALVMERPEAKILKSEMPEARASECIAVRDLPLQRFLCTTRA